MENRCPPESVNSLLTPCAFKRLATSRPPWKVCVSCSASRVADIDGDSTCSAPARALESHSARPRRASSRCPQGRRPIARRGVLDALCAADDARGGTRTHMPFRAADFKSAAYAHSATRACLGQSTPPSGEQCAPVRPRESETRRLLRCQGGYGSLTRIGRLVEASAFTHASALPGLRGPSALLRLQSD